jgi:sugar lactone lactonase YvrE
LTIAGTGQTGFSGDGGPATAARLWHPYDVAVDGAGNLYIADRNNGRIRKVTPNGMISTLAFASTPTGITVDNSGNVFVADAGGNRVWRIAPDGSTSTAAGTGKSGFSGDGGKSDEAQLSYPASVALDGSGNLYIADLLNNRIRKVAPNGTISTVAGNGSEGFSGDGGPATGASLRFPWGVAVDAAGTVYIADSYNHRIRQVSANGSISTIAGSELPGSSGDGGLAINAKLSLPLGLAVDGTGNLYVADSANHTIRKVIPGVSSFTFSMGDRGGRSVLTSGDLGSLSVGYGRIQPNAGTTTPAGVAIFSYRQGGILVTEAGVPASPLVTGGRIYAEVKGAVNTGLAIANPNSVPVTVSFFFTNQDGTDFGNGSVTLPANSQIARFLNEDPFNAVGAIEGALTFTSTSPVAVIALRGFVNQRSEFLMTTLPVVDLLAATPGAMSFPHYADGEGWTTQLILVNPSDTGISGTVEFFSPAGTAASVTVNGQTQSLFAYTVPPRSSQRLSTSGLSVATQVGTVRVTPSAGQLAPSGLAVFSFQSNGITIMESGVRAVPAGSTFRMYAEASGILGQVGSIQTGVAVANPAATPATLTLTLTQLDGTPLGLTGTLTVPSQGQVARFLNQIPGFESLVLPFQGVLRLATESPSGISIVSLRVRYNERGDFLISTTPPIDEASPSTSAELLFPHFVDSGGFTTQFILFSGLPGQSSSGTLRFFNTDGSSLQLLLR